MNSGPPLIVSADGGEPRRLQGADTGDVPSVFSSDGRSLFVMTSNPPGATIHRFDLVTGHRTAWKTLMPADKAGLLDVGMVQLSADARSYVYSYRRVLSTLFEVDGLR